MLIIRFWFFILLFLFGSSTAALAQSVTLTTVEWQPFYGKDLPEEGFFAALAREAFKRAGYDLQIQFQPWKRALETARKGKFDGLLGAYFNEQRAEHFLYSDVVYENKDVFVSLQSGPQSYDTLEDLKPYRIGVIRASAYADELSSQGFTIVEANDDLQALRMLLKKRIDIVITSEAHFHYLSSKHEDLKKHQAHFTMFEKPFRTYELFCAISKTHPEHERIVKQFNAALDSMKTDGEFIKIVNRFKSL